MSLFNRTEIINTALRRLGSAGVNLPDVTVSSPTGQLAEGAFQGVLEYCLALFPWDFATRYVRLPQVSTVPSFGYAHAYQLPADCVRVVDIRQNDSRDTLRHDCPAYELSGSILFTDAAPCLARYVSTEVQGKMPAQFANILAWRLAFEISAQTTQGAANSGDIYKLFLQSVDEAKELQGISDNRKLISPALASRMVAERFN